MTCQIDYECLKHESVNVGVEAQAPPSQRAAGSPGSRKAGVALFPAPRVLPLPGAPVLENPQTASMRSRST